MMLHIFKNGSSALVDEKANISVVENGQPPTKIMEATDKNLEKYFYTKTDKKITIKT